jgi:hypothetical protein
VPDEVIGENGRAGVERLVARRAVVVGSALVKTSGFRRLGEFLGTTAKFPLLVSHHHAAADAWTAISCVNLQWGRS